MPQPKTVVAKPSAKKTSTKGYNPLAPERISEILKKLDETYPDVTCALTHRSAWELLVATILSAQSTDVNVNKVTPIIFQKYPTVQDFAALTPEQLENLSVHYVKNIEEVLELALPSSPGEEKVDAEEREKVLSGQSV